MKKITLISLLVFSFSYAQAEPPYETTVWELDIITSKDPTTFQELIYIGEERRNMHFTGFDKNRKPAKQKLLIVRPYVFHAFHENEIAIEILICYEKDKQRNFKSVEGLTLEFAKIIGSMPHVLVQRLDAVHIYPDKSGYATGAPWTRTVSLPLLNLEEDRLQNYIDELLVHELVHASLDKPPGVYKALNPRISRNNKKTKILNWSHWRKAVKKDKEFISDPMQYQHFLKIWQRAFLRRRVCDTIGLMK